MLKVTFFIFFSFFSLAIFAKVDPLCGIAGYKEQSHPLCGSIFFEARSLACGVELYRQGPDMSCPGSHYEYVKDYFEVDNDGGDSIHAKPKGHWVYKSVAAPGTCRLEKFGSEVFKLCRHPNHGTENFKTCSDPSFPPIYKNCEMIMNQSEIETFLIQMETQLEPLGIKLLSMHETLIRATNNATSLACFIEKYKDEESAAQIVSDLISNFLVFTGEIYDPALAAECDKNLEDFSSIKCTETSKNATCQAQKIYNATYNYLTEKRDLIARLSNDLVAKNNAETKNRLALLLDTIDRFVSKK